MLRSTRARSTAITLAAFVLSLSGCTGLHEYIHNGFKVGPSYCLPVGETAERWIDDADGRLREDLADLSCWWSVFQDPVLDELIANAQVQNLSLREAGFRVLRSRAQLGITRGNLFPQSQYASGSFRRANTPVGPPSPITAYVGPGNPLPEGTYDFILTSEGNFVDQWSDGFSLGWELDFWGRYRRAVASAEHTLEASAAGYDEVLVTLLGDIAATYVHIRTLQTRIEFVQQNIAEQRKIVRIIRQLHEIGDPRPERRLQQPRQYHVEQIKSILAQTESAVPQLQIELRLACNRLCVLLGIPPRDVLQEIRPGPIPTAPREIVVGIPADLLRRRPDIRRAERQVAAQAEQIGIATAEFYPSITISGTLGYSSPEFDQLFNASRAFNSNAGPSFRWNILNYGRILNNVRAQDAHFRELLANYQNMVLQANAEVESGLVRFLRAQERAAGLDRSVAHMQRAVAGIEAARELRGADANQISIITQTKVQQQDLQAQAHGEVAQGLIQVYRALGGGWEVQVISSEAIPMEPSLPDMPAAETLPAPAEAVPSPTDR
ncbi:MAG: efflux transporter outer membrane subunit [Candidatus Anammoximicrobium sp.]|nr:efflux transporter outer membrane subunit [Candidatus Anammoximicrobium sp.]